MIDLSIILPTCNRDSLLERNIQTIMSTVQCNWEMVVIDGASTDNTWPILLRYQQQLGDKLHIIREEKRRGFVKAMNQGFLSAKGRNMMWLNDDARPLPGAIDQAVNMIDSAPADVAFLAMFHRWSSTRNVAYQAHANNTTYSLCHIRGTLYANFPMGRRAIYDELGYFDEQFVFCGADPDLSLKAWHAGYRVEPAWGVCIDHDEHEDERRKEDSPQLQADNVRLFNKWDLPPKNQYKNDFDPARPCTLRGLKYQNQEVAA